MWDVVVGILVGLFGLLLCFAGLRVFFIALPFLGFIAGFFVGAAGVTAIFDEGFLSSLTGIIVGLIVGLVFGLLAYLLWYVGALLAAGSTGALLGSALMNAIGVDSGWAVFIAAAIGAVLLFVVAFILALPIYVVIVNTAFVGAAGVITGILLIFNQFDRADLGYGLAWATIEESWLWAIAWLVLAVLGVLTQLRSIAVITLPEDRWTTASPSAA
jgi:hypothetical protein